MVIDDGYTSRSQVMAPAGCLQLLKGEQHISLSNLDEGGTYLGGDSYVAGNATTALRHAQGVGFLDVISGGYGSVADYVAGKDNSLTAHAGNKQV